MYNQIYAVIETLKTLKVDPAFDNVDKWVGCVVALERIAYAQKEVNTDAKPTD